MRKRKQGKELSRKRAQRKALMRTLGNSFILKEKIKTTETKAKEVKRFVEKAITKAKRGDLQTIRLLLKDFSSKAVKKLVDEIGPRYKTRPGGYTRIVKLGPRSIDGAKIVIIEMIK